MLVEDGSDSLFDGDFLTDKSIGESSSSTEEELPVMIRNGLDGRGFLGFMILVKGPVRLPKESATNLLISRDMNVSSKLLSLTCLS